MQPRLSFADAKNIPITGYLAGLGHEPSGIRGVDYWYYSPFREERTPSFKVNSKLNVWYDHGTGEGGTILDLGAKLHGCTLFEFLEKLSQGNRPTSIIPKAPLDYPKPVPRLQVLSDRELVNPDLLYYLRSRGIDSELAQRYCREVEFRIDVKHFSAIGFPNIRGAYELRNRWFKGSSSPKDISLIQRGSSSICVLEGFMDFLSLQKIDHREVNDLVRDANFLILNSLRLLNRTLPVLASHKVVTLFLDNDRAAEEAKKSLLEKGIHFHDASIHYKEHKDVNDFLVESMSNKPSLDHTPRKSQKIRR